MYLLVSIIELYIYEFLIVLFSWKCLIYIT